MHTPLARTSPPVAGGQGRPASTLVGLSIAYALLVLGTLALLGAIFYPQVALYVSVALLLAVLRVLCGARHSADPFNPDADDEEEDEAEDPYLRVTHQFDAIGGAPMRAWP